MKEEIEDILMNSYDKFGNFDEPKATKELLNLLNVIKCDNLMCENKAKYFYCNECENHRNDI